MKLATAIVALSIALFCCLIDHAGSYPFGGKSGSYSSEEHKSLEKGNKEQHENPNQLKKRLVCKEEYYEDIDIEEVEEESEVAQHPTTDEYTESGSKKSYADVSEPSYTYDFDTSAQEQTSEVSYEEGKVEEQQLTGETGEAESSPEHSEHLYEQEEETQEEDQDKELEVHEGETEGESERSPYEVFATYSEKAQIPTTDEHTESVSKESYPDVSEPSYTYDFDTSAQEQTSEVSYEEGQMEEQQVSEATDDNNNIMEDPFSIYEYSDYYDISDYECPSDDENDSHPDRDHFKEKTIKEKKSKEDKSSKEKKSKDKKSSNEKHSKEDKSSKKKYSKEDDSSEEKHSKEDKSSKERKSKENKSNEKHSKEDKSSKEKNSKGGKSSNAKKSGKS